MNKKDKVTESLSVGFMAIVAIGAVALSAYWLVTSFNDVVDHFITNEQAKVIFYRDQFSALGLLLIFVPLIIATVIYKVSDKKITGKKEKKFNKAMLSGLALLFLVPFVAQMSYNARYENNPTYTYCEEESKWWLLSLTRVYVKDMNLCGIDKD